MQSVGKAVRLSDNFNSKQCTKFVKLCSLVIDLLIVIMFAFLSSEDPSGGTDQLGMFPVFMKRTAVFNCLSSNIGAVFRQLLRMGSLLSGARPMLPKIRKVQLPPLLSFKSRFL